MRACNFKTRFEHETFVISTSAEICTTYVEKTNLADQGNYGTYYIEIEVGSSVSFQEEECYNLALETTPEEKLWVFNEGTD